MRPLPRFSLPTSVIAVHVMTTSAVLAVGPDTTLLTPYAGTGCWVAVFGKDNYRPPTARLIGPTFLENFSTGPVVTPELEAVGGQAFLSEIDSLIVGPRAVFLVYEGENFVGKTLEFPPDQRVPDLSTYDFRNKAQSARIRCEPQAE